MRSTGHVEAVLLTTRFGVCSCRSKGGGFVEGDGIGGTGWKGGRGGANRGGGGRGGGLGGGRQEGAKKGDDGRRDVKRGFAQARGGKVGVQNQ